jgi:hypothetical protein
MKEDKSIEVMNKNEIQILQASKVCNRPRMLSSPAHGNQQSNLLTFFSWMKECKLIEANSTHEMRVRQESKVEIGFRK